MLIKELIIEFMEYYRKSIPNFIYEFKILQLNKEGFEFIHNDSQVKMHISFEDMRSDGASPDMFCETELIGLLDKNKIEEFNNGIEVFDDCGFHSKNAKYTELLIKYETLFDIDPFFINNFTIGDIEVEISEPSSLYKLIFNNTYKYHIARSEEDWSDYFTVKIKNCHDKKLEETIQHIIFLIISFIPPEYKMEGDYPKISTFRQVETYYFKSIEDQRLDSGHFQPTKYYEPIALYNSGIKSNESIYYYRVLEFFFIINQKSEIKEIIENYNSSNDMDEFIKNMDKIYGRNEEKNLINLIKNIKDIREVIEQAKEYQLVSSNDHSIFAKELYKYRNSFVHAKWDFRHEISIPQILQNQTKDDHWRIILRKLSEMVIKQFCL